jgi:hypothetical protein
VACDGVQDAPPHAPVLQTTGGHDKIGASCTTVCEPLVHDPSMGLGCGEAGTEIVHCSGTPFVVSVST